MNTSSSQDVFPRPDPTKLTTEQLDREVSALKEAGRAETVALKELVLMKISEQRESVNIALKGVEDMLKKDVSNIMEDFKHHASDDVIQHDRLRIDSRGILETAVTNLKENIVLALASSKEAVNKAELANEKRFADLITALSALTLRQTEFITRPEHDQLIVRIQDLTNRINTGEGRSTGVHDGWKYFLGALGGMASLAGIGGVILALFNFMHIAGK